jgi:hypothetical protein
VQAGRLLRPAGAVKGTTHHVATTKNLDLYEVLL